MERLVGFPEIEEMIIREIDPPMYCVCCSTCRLWRELVQGYNVDKETCLNYAVKHRYRELIIYLAEQGAMTAVAASYFAMINDTPIISKYQLCQKYPCEMEGGAAAGGHLELLKRILEYADKTYASVSTFSASFKAVVKKQDHILDWLLSTRRISVEGIVEGVLKRGDLSYLEKYVPRCRYLAGAEHIITRAALRCDKPDYLVMNWLYEHRYTVGFCCLISATKLGKLELVKWCLEHHVRFDYLLYRLAADKGHYEVFRYFLDIGFNQMYLIPMTDKTREYLTMYEERK